MQPSPDHLQPPFQSAASHLVTASCSFAVTPATHPPCPHNLGLQPSAKVCSSLQSGRHAALHLPHCQNPLARLQTGWMLQLCSTNHSRLPPAAMQGKPIMTAATQTDPPTEEVPVQPPPEVLQLQRSKSALPRQPSSLRRSSTARFQDCDGEMPAGETSTCWAGRQALWKPCPATSNMCR